MKQSQRTVAFFCAMFFAFGISGLDFENPAFEYNKLNYGAIAAGTLFLIIFLVQKFRK